MRASQLGWVAAAILAFVPGAEASSWADGLFDELSKDFAIVSRGSTLVHHFRIKNTTGQPVGISNVRVSCGCVSASALKTYLQPDEETAVVARMDTTRFRGVKTVTIYVHFNKPKSEEVRLWVKANARDDFSISPESLDLGTIRQGLPKEATTTIRFHGQPDLQIQEVRPDSHFLLCKIVEVSRGGNESVYELKATLRKDTPAGIWFSDIWLRTDSSQIPQVRIPVTLTVESHLSATPSQIQLGTLAKGEEVQRKVVVRGLSPFKILKVEGLGGKIEMAELSKEAKAVHVITMTVKAEGTKKLPTAVTILTDSKDQPQLEIPILGEMAH